MRRIAAILLLIVFATPAFLAQAQAPGFDQLVAAAPRGEGLIAGAAFIDITPKRAYTDRVYLAGYMNDRKSTGVRDPIFARALFLFDGKTPLVIVSLDLVGYFYDDVQAVKDLVTRKYADNLIITSVHNHHGPDTMGLWGPGFLIPFSSGKDKKYMAVLRKKIASVIKEAASNARPAKLRFGSTTFPKGLCVNIWAHPDQQDHEMSVMAVDGTDGRPIATLTNYGCHVETQEEFNTKLSADFPGHFYRMWEEAHGGVAMFISGAQGGQIAPATFFYKWGPIGPKVKFAEKIGRTLSDTTAEALEGAAPVGPKGVSITIAKRPVSFPFHNKAFEYAFNQGILQRSTLDRSTNTIGTEVNAFIIGPAWFVGVPGEIFPSLAFEIRSLMKGKPNFILTLTNDELGYIMTKEQFHNPIHSYEQTVSLGEDTGPVLMDALKELISALPQQGRR